MKEKQTVVGINEYEPIRIRMNETKMIKVEFLDDLENFVAFVKEFPFERRSPIMNFDRPVDGLGMERYKEHVTKVSQVIITPNILVLHIETDPELDERLARESEQEAKALGDV